MRLFALAPSFMVMSLAIPSLAPSLAAAQAAASASGPSGGA